MISADQRAKSRDFRCPLQKKAQHDQRHRDDAGVGEHVGQVERRVPCLGDSFCCVLKSDAYVGGQQAKIDWPAKIAINLFKV